MGVESSSTGEDKGPRKQSGFSAQFSSRGCNGNENEIDSLWEFHKKNDVIQTQAPSFTVERKGPAEQMKSGGCSGRKCDETFWDFLKGKKAQSHTGERRSQRGRMFCEVCRQKVCDDQMWQMMKGKQIQTQEAFHIICLTCYPMGMEGRYGTPPLPPSADSECEYRLGSKHEYAINLPGYAPIYD